MDGAVLQAIVFLAATSLLVPAFRRLGFSAVMAFLIIGLLIGPNVLGRFSDMAPWIEGLALDPEGPAHWLAEFGVVFLLFAIGLEVSPERLWTLRKLVLGLGGIQIAATAVAILLIALAFGNALDASIVVGVAFALSSTAVVLQILGERRQLAGVVGRASFSILLMQDLAVIPILFAVGALSANAERSGLSALASGLGAAAIAIVAIVVVGRFLMRPLFRWAASIQSREVFMAAALLVVVGAALGAQAAGLSMALGAFLAGLLLAETEFRHEIETDIEPFKGLLLGLFFVTVGMQIDLGLIASEPVRIAIGVIGLFLVKIAVLAPLARAFGFTWAQSIESAFLLAQAGEFAFVIISLANQSGIVTGEAAQYFLLVIAVSLFLTPLVSSAGVAIAKRLAQRQDQTLAPEAAADAEGHVVIAGYGRVGQALGDLLQQQEVAHVAIDRNAAEVADLRKRGWPIYFGDASRKDVLAAVGAEHASAIVVTMDSPAAVELVVATVRAAWPHVPVYARARDPAQAKRLYAAGASFASPETIEATLQLGEALLNGLGFPDEAAHRVIAEKREATRVAISG